MEYSNIENKANSILEKICNEIDKVNFQGLGVNELGRYVDVVLRIKDHLRWDKTSKTPLEECCCETRTQK